MIDFDGIDQRIVAAADPGGRLRQPAGRRGRADLLPAAAPAHVAAMAPPAARSSASTSTKRKTETVAAGVVDYTIAAGRPQSTHRDPRRRCAWLTRPADPAWSIIDSGGGIVRPGPGAGGGGDGELNLDAVEVKVDPRAEWKQIFHEAWRINRDYFYDPNMHGADWNAVQGQVRAVPAAPRHRAATSTASSAGCSASWPSATATPLPGERLARAEDRPRRPARRRLRDRRRPLSLQEGLRRPELDARTCARR